MTTTENLENFGSDEDDFDLDAWIDLGTRPRREVPIYRDWSLLEEAERLTALLQQEGDGDDESLDAENPREQLEDVIARMEASQLVLTVQALTSEEMKELAEKAPTKPLLGSDGKPLLDANGVPRTKVDSVALGDMMAAAATIRVLDVATGRTKSTISEKQVRALRVKLGDGPMASLYRAVTELAQAGQVLPSVPFSPER